MSKIAVGLAHWHLNMKIAGGDLVGRRDQAPDRRDETVGEGKTKPRRGQEHDQGDQDEHGRESDPDPAAVIVESIVKGDELGRLFWKLPREWIDRPGHISKRVPKTMKSPE